MACCFVTLFRSYTDGQELTGTYNANYLRTYDTWGVAGTPPTVRVTPDTFPPEELRRKAWPRRSMSTARQRHRHGATAHCPSLLGAASPGSWLRHALGTRS